MILIWWQFDNDCTCSIAKKNSYIYVCCHMLIKNNLLSIINHKYPKIKFNAMIDLKIIFIWVEF